MPTFLPETTDSKQPRNFFLQFARCSLPLWSYPGLSVQAGRGAPRHVRIGPGPPIRWRSQFLSLGRPAGDSNRGLGLIRLHALGRQMQLCSILFVVGRRQPHGGRLGVEHRFRANRLIHLPNRGNDGFPFAALEFVWFLMEVLDSPAVWREPLVPGLGRWPGIRTAAAQ